MMLATPAETKANRKLIIVSNRLPVSVERRGTKLHFYASAGGLATGLGSFYREHDALWIGWPGAVPKENQKEVMSRLISELNCLPCFIPEKLAKRYYEGFANNTIWPLFHSFPAYAEYSAPDWEAYLEATSRFCERVTEVADPRATIWVHDYHLLLLSQSLRQRIPNAKIGFFLHIPFPSYDILRLLPWHRQILEALLHSDLIGFHTYDYAQSFLRSVRRSLGHDHSIGQIIVGHRVVQVDVFPMGIDSLKFSRAARRPEVEAERAKIEARTGDRKVVFTVSRLDYTKGIPQSLQAIDVFFERYPEWQGKVEYLLVIVPSREGVAQYARQKREIDELVGRINSKYSALDWLPIRYLYRHLTFEELVALYSSAAVALIVPLRDGMNLIAKEYIATRTDENGVLILSETAGAAKELREALVVNPNSQAEIADALQQALSMPKEEQMRRTRIMRARLESYDVRRWVAHFLERLAKVATLSKGLAVRFLDSEARKQLIEDYSKASRRLILLDYDGTLIPLMADPEDARPTREVLGLLRKLSSEPRTELVLLSGRDRPTLDRWFGHLDLTVVAEHGAWMRRRKQERWKPTANLDNRWKEQIRPVLELFIDRIPGSSLEEKDYSLAWHYRRADPEAGADAAKELIDNLTNLTANLEIHVLPGNKVVEVKSSNVGKGTFYTRYLARRRWDFTLALGDDWTDETLFSALPRESYSIRVGFAASAAMFNLESQREVLVLLKDLASNRSL